MLCAISANCELLFCFPLRLRRFTSSLQMAPQRDPEQRGRHKPAAADSQFWFIILFHPIVLGNAHLADSDLHYYSPEARSAIRSAILRNKVEELVG
jgi:hypothetical protein